MKKSYYGTEERAIIRALSFNLILLSTHQKDQISVSQSMSISATSVEGLVAPDCRGGALGHI